MSVFTRDRHSPRQSWARRIQSEAHGCVHKGPLLAASIMSQKNPIYTLLCYLKPTLILSSHLSLGYQAVSKFYNQNPVWIPRISLRATWPAKLILIHIPAGITNDDRHYANFSKLLLTVFSSARWSRTTAAFTFPSTKGHTDNKTHDYCSACSNLDVSTQHNTTQHNTAQHNTTHNTKQNTTQNTQHNTKHNTTQNTTQHKTQHNTKHTTQHKTHKTTQNTTQHNTQGALRPNARISTI